MTRPSIAMALALLPLLPTALAMRSLERLSERLGERRVEKLRPLRAFNATGLRMLMKGAHLPLSLAEVQDQPSAHPPLPAEWRNRLSCAQMGEGGFGVVLKCRVICGGAAGGQKEAYVSVKWIRDKHEENIKEVKALREMSEISSFCVSSIGSPDFIDNQDGLWIMMPHFNGGSLREFLNKQCLDRGCAASGPKKSWPADIGGDLFVLALFYEIVEGVQAMHSKQLVHMDLKPDNIMLNYDSSGTKMHAVVIDLGLACHFGECEQCGSPGYIAPEVVLDNAHVGKAANDVWSLGAILYDLTYSARPPFSNDVLGSETVRYSPQNDSNILPAEPMDALILGMLNPDPYARLTLDQVLARLEEYIMSQDPSREVLNMMYNSPQERGISADRPDCIVEEYQVGDIGDEPFRRSLCHDKPTAANFLRCGVCWGCNPCCTCRVMRHLRFVQEHFRMEKCQ
ncbi:unnamed protein product [Effrenium voratum]|nr:unnamed protein product [Effrenium voratum]